MYLPRIFTIIWPTTNQMSVMIRLINLLDLLGYLFRYINVHVLIPPLPPPHPFLSELCLLRVILFSSSGMTRKRRSFLVFAVLAAKGEALTGGCSLGGRGLPLSLRNPRQRMNRSQL